MKLRSGLGQLGKDLQVLCPKTGPRQRAVYLVGLPALTLWPKSGGQYM